MGFDPFSFAVGALVGVLVGWATLVLAALVNAAGREADREPPPAGSPWREQR